MHGIASSATLPIGSAPGLQPRGSSATTLPPPSSPRSGSPRPGSGLFGQPRSAQDRIFSTDDERATQTRETILVQSLPPAQASSLPDWSDDPFRSAYSEKAADLSKDPFLMVPSLPPAQASSLPPTRSERAADLANDPFLTHLKSKPNEDTPLDPLAEDPKFQSKIGSRIIADDAKLLVLPLSCCMMIQTALSGVVLSMSFNESGHRDGYEEGHLSPEDQHSGCQAAFWWLLMQASCDLFLTLFSCALLLFPLKSDPTSFHGCVAALRLCTLSAGFHILYFSGLKRELCDEPLIIWSTVIIWLGIGFMIILSGYLLCLLVGVAGKQQRQLQFAPQPRTQRPVNDKQKSMYNTFHAQKQDNSYHARDARWVERTLRQP